MNALFEIEIGYGVKLPDAARALLSEASIVPLEFDAEGRLPSWNDRQPIISIDALAQLRALLGAKDEVHIKRVIGNSSTAALERFGQRNTTIENTRCNVAVAGLGLLTIDEVQHENDCCTDHLQDLLNDGWRILAVCVQPDQRRPDYILGRTNTDDRALRKIEADRPRPMPTPVRHAEPPPAEPPQPAAAQPVARPAQTFGEQLPPTLPPEPPARIADDDNDIPF